ncbi:MAG TPA: PadR family transcriptional regulator [Bellilinea sp.]|nr:PadR family transcriptional regulator [Bellilinea sp.]
MEYVVLGLLMLGEATLYELRKAFERGISLFYSASFGSIQFALKKLLHDGSISMRESVEGGRNKKIYAITPKGQAAFLGWIRSADIPESKLDTIALTKLYFLGVLPTRADRTAVLAAITERVKQSEEALREFNNALTSQIDLKAVDPVMYYQLMSLDYGVTMMRHSRTWYEEELRKLTTAK